MRKSALGVVLIIIAVAVYLYFTPQGRTLAGRIFGWSQQATDLAISSKVKAAFALSKRLSAYDINIATKDGVVTINGQVPTEVDKDLAGNVAKDVPDVKNVNNQLQVQPGLKPSEATVREGMRVSDLEIRADLNERLLASQALQGHSIQVGVQERIVTLTGRVDTPAQKAGAEQLARSVSNVVDVVNNLTVNNPAAAFPESPGLSAAGAKDKDLATRVLFALFKERDNFVDIAAIKTTSREGIVTLTGPAGSRAERALAERIVREVDGVKGINNQLSVTGK
ncbi:MAG: BON domain-containing protein [Acidobacteria bacterium]|nr:BON domain-containing protein [Acidobacteriota bacterium]